MKIVSMILGGGVGSRLYPLTEMRSKPAVPIGGKYRLIDIPISNCLNSGIRQMFVLTQFNSASLNRHIKNTYHFDGFSNGFVDILAAEQTHDSANWFEGTADAVSQCMRHLGDDDYDYIMILSGDQLYQMDLAEFAKEHIEKKADVSIATIPVNAKDATGFGIMKVKEGLIDSFIEKPKKELLKDWKSKVSAKNKKAKKEYLASMGIYIFSKKAIKDLFKKYNEATDFGKEIIPHAIEDGYKVASYQYDGYWEDIGTVSSFFEASLELASPLPKFNFFDNSKIIHTRPRKLPASKLFKTRLDKALLGEGCIIRAKSITNAVVGIRSRIGDKSVLKNVVMFGYDYYESLEEVLDKDSVNLGIGTGCHIENAIIDKGARIGDNVSIIGNESLENVRTEQYCIVDGIVVLRKNAVIPAGTVIGKKPVKTAKKITKKTK